MGWGPATERAEAVVVVERACAEVCYSEALYIAPDIVYDPTTMEDAIGTGSVEQETIICTTDLGLVRAEKVAGTRGDWKEAVLLKPKVVLYSGIAGIVKDTDSPL